MERGGYPCQPFPKGQLWGRLPDERVHGELCPSPQPQSGCPGPLPGPVSPTSPRILNLTRSSNLPRREGLRSTLPNQSCTPSGILTPRMEQPECSLLKIRPAHSVCGYNSVVGGLPGSIQSMKITF